MWHNRLGPESYAVSSKYNGLPAAGLAINLAPGANALDTAKAIRATLAQLAPFYPAGLKTYFPYDTTPFVKVSIEEVLKTLFEAIVLVFIVMYVFLQNFRATLIPTIAVPVVLLGTFGILAVAGFSINTLTMFGMVLAIGLLVDDAIVVVENVERVIVEDKLANEAARKSMGQITGALVGIALVLSAVFLPMAFFSGSTGVIYRQFSVTIVSAMALSVLVALILTPALCATLLKVPQDGELKHHGGFFGWFNRNFERMNHGYTAAVEHVTRRTGRYLLLYAGIVVLIACCSSPFPSPSCRMRTRACCSCRSWPRRDADRDHRRGASIRCAITSSRMRRVQCSRCTRSVASASVAAARVRDWPSSASRDGVGSVARETTAWPRSPRGPTSTSPRSAPRSWSPLPLRRCSSWVMRPALILNWSTAPTWVTRC
jgi:hypothetical protein